MEEKELKALTDGFNKANADLKKELAELAGKVDKVKAEEINTQLKELGDKVESLGKIGEKNLSEYIKTLQDQQDSQAAKIKELEVVKAHSKGFKSIIEETVKDETFKKSIKSKDGDGFDIKDGAEKFLQKAGSEMTTGNFTADAGAVALSQVEIPGIEKHPWALNPVFAAVRKVFVSDKKHTITWSEENTRDDEAAGIAESGTYGRADVTFIKRVASFFKIGQYADYTEETMEDSDEFAAELNDLLLTGTMRKVEYDLLLGNGTNTFTGLIYSSSPLAKAFTAPTSVALNVIQPGVYDVLRAAQLQVREGYHGTDANKKGYMANLALVAPGTLANMDMEKTNDGVYMKPFWANGQQVNGMMVMESDDIGADQFLVGDFSQLTLYIKRSLNIQKTDSDGSKFLDDVSTVKASIRVAEKLATLKRYAFVYGTFTDGKEQIRKASN